MVLLVNRHFSAPKTASKDRGFSLVELLVAIALGMALAVGLALMFSNSSRSNTELDKSLRQMENGRYAVDLLTEEFSMAGYYGEIVLTGMTYSTPAPCATALADLGWVGTGTVPVPVVGLNSTEAAALACLPNRAAGSGAVVVRRLDTAVTPVASMPSGSSTVYIQSSRCSDSSVDPVATKFVVSATSSDFTLHALNCTAINGLRKYIMRIFYVASCNECGVDTTPTLKRVELKDGALTTSALVEGIEEIKLEYGFDTNANGSPDVYRTGLSGTSGAEDNKWENVMAARLYILSRTTEPTAGFTETKVFSMGQAGTRSGFSDNYKRRVHTVSLRMNNPAGSREAMTVVTPP